MGVYAFTQQLGALRSAQSERSRPLHGGHSGVAPRGGANEGIRPCPRGVSATMLRSLRRR
eukprot:1023677-Alexandrium_andersonii.AAC.1